MGKRRLKLALLLFTAISFYSCEVEALNWQAEQNWRQQETWYQFRDKEAYGFKISPHVKFLKKSLPQNKVLHSVSGFSPNILQQESLGSTYSNSSSPPNWLSYQPQFYYGQANAYGQSCEKTTPTYWRQGCFWSYPFYRPSIGLFRVIPANITLKTTPSKASGNYYQPSTSDVSASGSYYAATPQTSPLLSLPQSVSQPPLSDYWGTGGNPFKIPFTKFPQ